MESLETQEIVINLGKKLIKNFEDNDPDEITVWMINYLAEKMLVAESGDEHAKRECFNTILELWEKQSVFPDGARPFENYEVIFHVLESLSPEHSVPFYMSQYYRALEDELYGEEYSLIEIVKHLDSTAKILITFFLESALVMSHHDDVNDWMNILEEINPNGGKYSTMIADPIDSGNKEQRIKKLNSRISQLAAFEDISKKIRKALDEELNGLENC